MDASAALKAAMMVRASEMREAIPILVWSLLAAEIFICHGHISRLAYLGLL